MGRGRGRRRERVQGIRRIIGRYQLVKGKVKNSWEMEKPKNLYVQPMDMN